MKKLTRVCLAAAGIIGSVGLAFSIAGVVSGASLNQVTKSGIYWDQDNNTLKNKTGDAAEYQESFKNIEKLDLELGVIDMVIRTGESDEFRVSAANIDGRFECEEKNGTLHIKYKDRNKWGWNETAHAVLEVPKGFVFKESDIDVGVGSLEAEELLTDKLDIDCGVGKTVITGAVNGDTNINCGIGEVVLSLDNSEEDYNYSIDCGIGEVNVGGSSYSGLVNRRKIDNDVKNDMDIKCGIGKVTVNFN